MASTKKQNIVSSLVAELKAKQTVVLTEYTGVTHQQLEALRKEIRAKGGVVHVVKNKLLSIAIKDAQLIKDKFEIDGPSAAFLSEKDNFLPLKALYEKAKELTGLKIKLGIWHGNVISDKEIINLATLPTKDELVAKLMGQLKSPQAKLVYALKGNLQKLTVVLNQIQMTKSK